MQTIRIVIGSFLLEVISQCVGLRKLVAKIQIMPVILDGISKNLITIIGIGFRFFQFFNYGFVKSFFLLSQKLFFKNWALIVVITRNNSQSMESSFFVFIISFSVDFFLNLRKLFVKFQLMNSRFHQIIDSLLFI
jgi:hypothetical protein